MAEERLVNGETNSGFILLLYHLLHFLIIASEKKFHSSLSFCRTDCHIIADRLETKILAKAYRICIIKVIDIHHMRNKCYLFRFQYTLIGEKI